MRAAPTTITTYNPSAANSSWRDVTGATDLAATVDPASAKGDGGVEVISAAAAAAHNICLHAVFDARL
jgi:hypothetical protein